MGEDDASRRPLLVLTGGPGGGKTTPLEELAGGHRPERSEDAIRLDHLLHRAWRDHVRYWRIDNEGRDWAAKAEEAKAILDGMLP